MIELPKKGGHTSVYQDGRGINFTIFHDFSRFFTSISCAFAAISLS